MRRRIFAVAISALLPAVGMLAYNEFWYRTQRNAEVHAQALQSASQVASEVDRIIEGVRTLLIASSAIPAVVDLDPPGCHEALSWIAKDLPQIRTILVFDLKGRLVCDSLGTPAGADFSDRDYFKRALVAEDLVVGGYTVSKITGKPVLPIARALKDGSEPKGVIVTGLMLDWLEERIKERGLLTGGAVTIADSQGMILARNPLPERFVGTRIPDDFQYLLHEKAPGTMEVTSQDGTVRIMGYQPVSAANPLYISAGISKSAVFAPINRATITGILLIVTGVLIALLASQIIGNRFILRPIQHIVHILERWGAGDLAARTKMRPRQGELGLVGASLDTLLDELDRRRLRAEEAEQARSLLSRELTHRVKNTLAIVQAIARQTFVGKVPADILDRFSYRIGALSGAYDTLLAENWERGDIRRVIDKVLGPHHAPDDQRFSISGPAIDLRPEVVIALSLILHELATNAAKYGALSVADGEVEIRYRQKGERLEFEWQERGGPPPQTAGVEGFGTRLIRRAFPSEFNPEVDFRFEPTGLLFMLSFDLA